SNLTPSHLKPRRRRATSPVVTTPPALWKHSEIERALTLIRDDSHIDSRSYDRPQLLPLSSLVVRVGRGSLATMPTPLCPACTRSAIGSARSDRQVPDALLSFHRRE